jgi:carboxyl-terminal processing protease
MKRTLVVILALLLSTNIFSDTSKDPRKEKLIGNILKNALETYHYRALKINDDLSQKSFGQYLKKIDGAKQFLTKQDVKELEVYKSQMDDEMVNGEYSLVEKSMSIMKKRIVEAETLRKEIFKKQFDFNGTEQVEIDPEKRDFAKDV